MGSFTPRSLCPQGKRPLYPLDRRLVGPRAGLDAVEKRKIPSLRRVLSNTRTPIVHPVASCYTDCVTSALNKNPNYTNSVEAIRTIQKTKK
jgi:hypothetical protein